MHSSCSINVSDDHPASGNWGSSPASKMIAHSTQHRERQAQRPSDVHSSGSVLSSPGRMLRNGSSKEWVNDFSIHTLTEGFLGCVLVLPP